MKRHLRSDDSSTPRSGWTEILKGKASVKKKRKFYHTLPIQSGSFCTQMKKKKTIPTNMITVLKINRTAHSECNQTATPTEHYARRYSHHMKTLDTKHDFLDVNEQLCMHPCAHTNIYTHAHFHTMAHTLVCDRMFH